jgi:hypothetical protein
VRVAHPAQVARFLNNGGASEQNLTQEKESIFIKNGNILRYSPEPQFFFGIVVKKHLTVTNVNFAQENLSS